MQMSGQLQAPSIFPSGKHSLKLPGQEMGDEEKNYYVRLQFLMAARMKLRVF
jgi:hypothetical protein